MNNVFIFHGTGGHSKENWFPWLEKELKNRDCKVFIPNFPTPEGQSLDSWLEKFKEYRQHINEDSIFIGHSLGGIFLLRILETIEPPVKAAIFTGTPIGVRPIKNYDSDNSFSGFQFDWSKIKSSARHFSVYHSDNDPYVSLGNGQKLAKELGVELTLIPNAGHFNERAGYTKFNELLKDVTRLLTD